MFFLKQNTVKESNHVKLHLRTLRITGWWFQPTPLKNISQLGSLFPIYGNLKKLFQTTNQITTYHTFEFFLIRVLDPRLCR